MATNIPPHNLGEVIAACRAYIDNPAITSEELMEHVPGPDFPTGAAHPRPVRHPQRLHHRPRLDHACAAAHTIEEGRGDRRSIVLTAIPYQVGKNGLVEKIAEAAKDKRIEGVTDIRDESNREGVRIVIDLKRDATPEVVLNQLWRHTPAQSRFPANMLAIRGGRPETLTLRDIIEAFIQLPRGGDHPPLEVRARQGARPGAHLARPGRRGHQPRRSGADHPRLGQPGRGAREAARARMAGRPRSRPTSRWSKRSSRRPAGDTYRLSEAQVRAILELRLHRLTALGRDEIGDELEGARRRRSANCSKSSATARRLYEVMREEFDEVASRVRHAAHDARSPPPPTASRTRT